MEKITAYNRTLTNTDHGSQHTLARQEATSNVSRSTSRSSARTLAQSASGTRPHPRVKTTATPTATPIQYAATPAEHTPAPTPRRSKTSRQAHVSSVDGLRLLAILAVVIYHVNPSMLPGGFFGVTTFFVLTGFFFARSLLSHEQRCEAAEAASHKAASSRVSHLLEELIDSLKTLGRRVARLLPEALFGIAGIGLISYFVAPYLFLKYLHDAIPAGLFFENIYYLIRNISYFAQSGLPSPLTHYWFLSIIMQFYIVWLVVFKLTRFCFRIPNLALALKRHRFLKTPNHLRIVIALVLLMLSSILMVLLYNPIADTSRVYYGIDTRLAELLAGSILALMYEVTAEHTHQNLSFLRRFTFLRTWNAQLVACLQDLLAIILLVVLILMNMQLNSYDTAVYRGGFLLAAILSMLLLALLLDPATRLMNAILGNRVVAGLGARSFSLYIWHYPLLLFLNPALQTEPLPWWNYLLQFVLICFVTELSYRLFNQASIVTQKKRALGSVASHQAHLLDTSHRQTRLHQTGQAAPMRRPAVGFRSAETSWERLSSSSIFNWVLAAFAACVIGCTFILPQPEPMKVTMESPQQAEQSEQSSQGQGSEDINSTESSEDTQQQSDQNSEQASGTQKPDPIATIDFVQDSEHGLLEKQLMSIAALADNLDKAKVQVDTETGATDASVLLIGDSVPAGAINQFQRIFPRGTIDAAVGRQFYTGLDIYQSYMSQGYRYDYVIISLGNNGVVREEQLRQLLDTIGADLKIYLVTARVPLALQDLNNQLFKDIAAQYDNVEVIDWLAESSGHNEYFWDDGTHLRPEGAEAYVLMCRRAITGR